MPGVLLEGEKGWVLLKYREVVLSLDESGWGSRVTSCQETKNVLDRWKKKYLLSAQENWSEFTSIYSVIFIRRKWHMSHLGFCRCRRAREQVWSVTSRRRSARRDACRLINRRTNQNGATELGWCHIMIRDRGFVKTRGIAQTLLSPGNHITTAVLAIFSFENLKDRFCQITKMYSSW